MAVDVTLVRATQDLTFSGNPANTETVTIGGKVYTFQSSLTNVDGNVLLGGSAEASIDNLVAAINLGAGAGTAYAAAMTRNEKAYAAKVSATVLRAHAGVPGSIGNHVPVAEASTVLAWGAGTLANGTGGIVAWLERMIALTEVGSEVYQELAKLTARAD